MPGPGASVPRDGSGYPAPRRTAAIVELGGVHEECVPALAHLLRLHAVEPTIYLNRRIRDGRPGFKGRFPELDAQTRWINLKNRGARKRFFDRLNGEDRPDLLVLNTRSSSPATRSRPSAGRALLSA